MAGGGWAAGRSGLGTARSRQASEWTLLLPAAWAEIRDRWGETATHAGHFPLDVLEELLLAYRRKHGCWNSVSSLSGLTQATLLDVDHLPEAICAQWSQGTAASGLGSHPSLQ